MYTFRDIGNAVSLETTDMVHKSDLSRGPTHCPAGGHEKFE